MTTSDVTASPPKYGEHSNEASATGVASAFQSPVSGAIEKHPSGLKSRLPNLFIIGASRSGTTSIHYTLGQHPQIYMSPVKETNFFSYYCHDGQAPTCVRQEDIRSTEGRSVKTLDDYRRLFSGVTTEPVVGETSPSYLLTDGVPKAIREFVPEAKVVAVLRQPIEKAYSHFARKCQAGIYSFDTDFRTALEQDKVRIRNEGRGTSLLAYARYYDNIKRYFEAFDREQLKICLFDDLETCPLDFYADLFRFLGVDENFRPDVTTKLNQSGRFKSGFMGSLTALAKPFRHQLRKYLPPHLAMRIWHTGHKAQARRVERAPALPPPVRRELTGRYYKDDIDKLQELIGRDLSHWLA